ncbi:uncharacterized protein LOC130630162 [Hydractinia symbiolongicarpus]|uniref:uncharacterized protein LOC130630162 n=1 Tax=Hydractinia symbiolongicarpus TaxID=13093 RepID=UPI002549CB76|nr:uncharacterized protein LOC130630162 [Hydractinia symbiolongicarpus]
MSIVLFSIYITRKFPRMYADDQTILNCCATIALHLEVGTNNTASTFILAFRRFVARRGIPSKVYSDNGSNFVSEEVQAFVSSIVSFATNELITIVAEVESVLNDRSLTYGTSEIGDEIITPNHLNYGRRLNVNPSSEENNDVSSHVHYLSELRERHKLTSKRQSRELINVEDVVLIKDDKLSRSKWKIGVVESVQLSKDEQIRVATVRTRSNGKNLLLKRAVNLLYPVET